MGFGKHTFRRVGSAYTPHLDNENKRGARIAPDRKQKGEATWVSLHVCYLLRAPLILASFPYGWKSGAFVVLEHLREIFEAVILGFKVNRSCRGPDGLANGIRVVPQG